MNWNPTGIPTGYGVHAEINRDPLANVRVSLTAGASLNSLGIEMGNTLDIGGTMGALGFGKNPGSQQPSLTNNGTISISDYCSLKVGGDLATFTGYVLTIRGVGTIRLYSGATVGTVNYGQVRIEIDPTFRTYNTVSGGGGASTPAAIGGWSETIPLINRGEINADYGYLTVDDVENQSLAWNGVLYGGILGTTNHGFLVLTKSIKGGIILPREGTVRLNNAILRNTTIGAGTTNVVYTSRAWESTALQAGAQVNILAGTRLDLYNSVVTNDGVIRAAPGGALRNWQSQAVLQGTGKVVLGGSTAALDAEAPSTNWIINTEGHTIEGGGTMTAWIANYGTLRANDHTMLAYGAVFGDGSLRIEGQDAANLAILDYRANSMLTTGSLHINEFGKLLLVNNSNLKVLGDFSFAQRDEALWPLRTKTLSMAGTAGWQKLEVGGEDLGLTPAGLVDNFALGTLHLEPGARVCLVDETDNGNRHSPEALYVNDLILDEGAELNLNGLVLYTYLDISGTPTLTLINQANFHEFEEFFVGSFVNWPVAVPETPAARAAILSSRPNPFNPATRISFSVPATMPVRLEVYDVSGRCVARLADAVYGAGTHEVDWNGLTTNGEAAGSGVYFGVLVAGSERSARKMVLLR